MRGNGQCPAVGNSSQNQKRLLHALTRDAPRMGKKSKSRNDNKTCQNSGGCEKASRRVLCGRGERVIQLTAPRPVVLQIQTE